jgi:hypothetical protein
MTKAEECTDAGLASLVLCTCKRDHIDQVRVKYFLSSLGTY